MPSKQFMHDSIVVDGMRPIVAQMLPAIQRGTDAECAVVSGKGVRPPRLNCLCSRHISVDFHGIDAWSDGAGDAVYPHRS